MISNIIRNYNRKEEKVLPYLEFKSSTPMTITPNYTNTGITLQYSLDTVTWTNIAAKAKTPSANVIYFRGRATDTKSLYTASNINNAWIFTNAINLEVHGDITMLIQDSLGDMVRDIPLGSYTFAYMFYNCTSLTTAPALPATTLAEGCYHSMLRECTSLIKAPNLASTTLANACYHSLFSGCTSLTTAPALPATTLVEYCYGNMFVGCTSLTATPALPATTLTNYCYQNMFFGCTSLTTAPALPATTLASSCYNNMFNGCSSLTIPPALPATTLAINCYLAMFQNCISLTTLPLLPATTLASSCYANMFNGCTKIKLSTTKTGGYVNEYRVPTVGTGIDNTNTMNSMFSSTGGTFVNTPTINTTYYTENQVI